MQVLKLFFQRCVRNAYSDQFQCRLALSIDQLSLISNARIKSERCNLQKLEINQRIESSDGQNWKSRRDDPTHTQKKETPPSDAGEKASMNLFRNAPRPRFVFIFFSFLFSLKNELEAASSTARFFALLNGNELPMPITFLSCFSVLSRAEFYAVNS